MRKFHPEVNKVQYLTQIVVFSMLLLCGGAIGQPLPTEPYTETVLAEDLNSPWGLTQLNESTWLVTERNGHVAEIKPGVVIKHALDLDSLYVAGQGGLLDILPATDFAQSKKLYVSYAQGSADANRLVIGITQFDGKTFSKVKEIFRVSPDKNTPVHYAGRLMWLPDDTLLVSSGEGFDFREHAQRMDSQLGKILRIRPDGQVPKDNPYVNSSNSLQRSLFSIGHRNTQGLVWDADNHQILSHEHGPAGGDEVNIIEPAKNYGWPVVTLGNDYSGARISPFREYPNMLNPIVNWTPSIAPSAMAYYANKFSDSFASLTGHILVTSLVDKRVYAVDLGSDDKQSKPVFNSITGRLRDISITPTGQVAILTDGENGKLYLLSPK